MPKLKQVRERAGLTQTDVGNWLGKDKRDISKLENYIFFPNAQDLDVLLKKFNCGVLELYNRNEIPVSTLKKAVETHDTCKTGVITYNYCVRLKKSNFPLLTKNVLNRCGLYSNREFLSWAYKMLERKYKKIIKKEQAQIEQAQTNTYENI